MGLRFELSFDEPDYNEIVSVSVDQLFPDINEDKGDKSFMPVLKNAVAIIKDMPQEDKGNFSFYILKSLLTSDKTPAIFRTIEKICKSTLDIQLTIVSISSSRVEQDNRVKIALDVSLEDIDYSAIVDKLLEIKAIDDAVPWYLDGPVRLLSNLSFVVEWLLPILNDEDKKKNILSAANNTIVEKTGIHIKNLDYVIK